MPFPPSTPRGRVLVVHRLTKVFASDAGPVVALDGIDVVIEPGEFVAIIGPSGCGKSTLMAITAGLETASSGTVSLGGTPVTGPVLDAGFMFQRDLLLDWRSCEDNVLLQFQMRGQPAAPHRSRARELLDLVGLGSFGSRYPRELSGGMRQRVAICRALVHDPSLLFMDEPFGALDAITRESLNAELARLTGESQATVLFVTHDIDEAVFLADRVLVMSPRPGRLRADVRIDLPRPRTSETRERPEFAQHTVRLRRLLAADDGASHHG